MKNELRNEVLWRPYHPIYVMIELVQLRVIEIKPFPIADNFSVILILHGVLAM